MLIYALQGITVGFSAGVMPGPLQGFLINTALKHGWQRALLVVLCPLIIDLPIILTVLFALDALAGVVPTLINGIRILGGLFLLYLAWGAWQDYRRGASVGQAEGSAPVAQETPRGTLTRGLMMNLLSPGPYLFWTTVNGPVLLEALQKSAWHGVAFVLGFYGVFLGCLALIAVGIAQVQRLNPQIGRSLLLVAALLLAGFGVYLLGQGAGLFAA